MSNIHFKKIPSVIHVDILFGMFTFLSLVGPFESLKNSNLALLLFAY